MSKDREVSTFVAIRRDEEGRVECFISDGANTHHQIFSVGNAEALGVLLIKAAGSSEFYFDSRITVPGEATQ